MTKNMPVSERSDDQTVSATEEFVLVNVVVVSDADQALVVVLFEVETGLFQPLEIRWCPNVHPTLKSEHLKIRV